MKSPLPAETGNAPHRLANHKASVNEPGWQRSTTFEVWRIHKPGARLAAAKLRSQQEGRQNPYPPPTAAGHRRGIGSILLIRCCGGRRWYGIGRGWVCWGGWGGLGPKIYNRPGE